MNADLSQLQEQTQDRFQSYFRDNLLPRFEKINEHRKSIVPVIKARNRLVLSGTVALVSIYILAEMEDGIILIIDLLVLLYSGPKGLVLGILTAGGLLLWLVKIWSWISQVRAGRELVAQYQDIYSRFVFESVGEFLGIDLNFSAVSVEDRKSNLTLKTIQSNETEEKIRNAMEQSALVDYDPKIGFISNAEETQMSWWAKTKRRSGSANRQIIIDDHVQGQHAIFPFDLTEMEIKQKQGKRHMKTVFKGVFIAIDLPTTLRDQTFILTKGDRKKVRGQGNWFTNMFRKKTIEHTTLEWNEFDNDLQVITGDEQEARYILTPDFMLTLHEWWKLKEQKIRTSFVGDRMCLMVPIDRVVIGLGKSHENFDSHYEYIESLMLSIWYTQQLVNRLPRQLSLDIDQNKIR